MRCPNCGLENGPEERVCAKCQEQLHPVRVLSREERESFAGVTVDEQAARDGYYEYESRGPNHRVYVKQVQFSSSGMSIWTKLLIAGILAVIIFVFLPLALFLIASAGLIWFIYSFLRR